MVRKGLTLIALLCATALVMSSNSACTSSTPRTRRSTLTAFSACPRCTRLLGVSGSMIEPIKSVSAGTAPSASDRRQPQGLMLDVPKLMSCAPRMPIVTASWNRMLSEPR